MLCLMEQNKVNWQTPLGGLLPYPVPVSYRKIRIGQLLSHSAGLPAYKPLYASFTPQEARSSKPKLMKDLLSEQLQYRPGEKCIYSDLGYILLGEIIEHVSATPLDTFFRREITRPLRLESKIKFRPLSRIKKTKDLNIAATENCPWRHRILQGEAHDEHCWLMNGVAGHAGLFGSITGVLSLLEHILGLWQGREELSAFKRTLLQKALKRPYPNETWCMGFDTPSPSGSSAGKYLSGKSVGHLGYTGTSFWVDPTRDIVITLLTNRVHPSRANEQIKTFRPLFHDTIMEVLLDE